MGAEPLYWEPWVLSVGQRVRVRLSAECQFRYPTTAIGHHPEMDGVAGVVSDAPLDGFQPCDHSAHDPSHRYSVNFDAPVVLVRGYRHRATSLGQCFAAAELEPLAS